MTTAWQKALLRRQAPKRRMFKIDSVEPVREGTYRIYIDGGSDGRFAVRVYETPRGRDYVCEHHDLNNRELQKLDAAIDLFLDRRAAPEQFSIMERRHGAGRHEPAHASVQEAMHMADAIVDKQTDVGIHGEYTADGAYWGPGRGRLVAVRERGRWTRF